MMWWSLAGALAGRAFADEAKRREADVRFHRGLELYDAKDFGAALAEFRAAHELTGAWEVLVHIAICERALFRYGEAARSFERYLAEGGALVEAKLRAQVERELVEIRALVAEVWVRVDGAAARIELDARWVGDSPLEEPLLVGPGWHLLRASRAGDDPVEKAIEVVSGERIEVELSPIVRPPPPKSAPVEIFTSPPGATLFVDGRSVGPSPWRGELDDGDHEVTAILEGYEKGGKDVTVRAGKARKLTIDLVRKPAPIGPVPIYARWTFWAGIGGGIALAVIGTKLVIDATRPDYDVVFSH